MFMKKCFWGSCLSLVLSESIGQISPVPTLKSDRLKQIIYQQSDSIQTHSFSHTDVENRIDSKRPLPANWHEINAFDQTVAFSKIAVLGKISVFVVSTAWCAPCKALKQSLLTVNKKYENFIDFYYVDMSQGHRYEDLKKTDAYFYARMYDRLKEWPRVTITAPTGSIVKNFSQEDLVSECQKNKLFEIYGQSAQSNQPILLNTAQKAMDDCNKVTVYDKIIEILERMLPHISKFNIQKTIFQPCSRK